MIKLRNILSEIKVIPRVTPEMCIILWDKIRGNNKYSYFDFNNFLSRKDLWELFNKAGWDIYTPQELNVLYRAMLQYQKENNLNEIQVKPFFPLDFENAQFVRVVYKGDNKNINNFMAKNEFIDLIDLGKYYTSIPSTMMEFLYLFPKKYFEPHKKFGKYESWSGDHIEVYLSIIRLRIKNNKYKIIK